MAEITRLGKIPVANWGKGTITKEDHDTGLRFKVLYWGNTDVYVGVRGESADAKAWAQRVGATVTTKEDAITARDTEAPVNSTCDMGFSHPTIKPEINDII